MNTAKFNPQELCSRKLWQIIDAAPTDEIADEDLSDAIAELEKRRHYLEELEALGKLSGPHEN